MPVTLKCPKCKSSLRVRDDLAGKKVKCPRCANLILVPVREEEVTEVLNAPDDGITEVKPTAKDKTSVRSARRREDQDEEREERVASKPRARPKPPPVEDEEEDEEEEERPAKKGKGKFKPCPSCGGTHAEKVLWTPWGSFYGPAMVNHVKCQDCGYCYNGKSGRSNLIPIILFVTAPLLGILGLLGGIAYIFYRQGYFGGG
jgi:predicted Zn finger-like uncharacterized protein